MFAITLQELAVCGLIALCVVATVYWFFNPTKQYDVATTSPQKSPFAPSFLFSGTTLEHACDGAENLIAKKLDNMPDWDATMLILSEDFPEVESFLTDIPEATTETIRSTLNPDVTLKAERSKEQIRLTVEGADSSTTRDVLHRLDQQSVIRELELLRSVAQDVPQLIWQEDELGKMTWCNQAYLTYADKARQQTETDVPVWPAKPLFANLKQPARNATLVQKTMQSLQLVGEDAEHWFTISSMPNLKGTLHVASDANDQVRSERDQKAFIQTFSKTFAQLSVGLAIFDRSRNLSMFNPALVQMTGLPVGMLSARPSIEEMLDQLRETGKLPEPRNYALWRKELTKLVDDAKSGTYHELWNLSDGQTFRVTGRPHPDGAIAFLFEDVSDEVSLTRRFRTELETSQSVIDTLPDAIAVFSHSLTLVISNSAYSELWGDQSEDLDVVDLKSALQMWTHASAPTRTWRQIEYFASSPNDRKPFRESIVLNNGRQVACDVQLIGGGLIMVKFSKQHPSTVVMNRLLQSQDNIPALR